jgi:hypothetical protein
MSVTIMFENIDLIFKPNDINIINSIHYIFISFLFINIYNINEIKDKKYDFFKFKHYFNDILNLNIFEYSDNILYSITKYIINLNFNKYTLLNDIFLYYNKKILFKNKYNKYYTDNQLLDWIYKLANIKIANNSIDSIYECNIKINSITENIIKECIDKNINLDILKNKLYSSQLNESINLLIKYNLVIISDMNYQISNLSNENIVINDIDSPIKKYDFIFCDLEDNIHNIIYTSCCNKIKKLKIRGTKYELLLLQLLLESLNENGRAIIIIPDYLLFSDSIQSINTRKFLIENYNLKKIIQINNSSDIKTSILYIENNNITSNVLFSILNFNNDIHEVILNEITVDSIQKNNCYLYLKKYDNINLSNNILDNINNLDQINFLISNKLSDIDIKLENKKILVLDKYYKNNESISIKLYKDLVNKPNIYYIYFKSNNDDFYIYYLYYKILNSYTYYLKGKLNQFDIDELSKIDIPIVPQNINNIVNNYDYIYINLIENNNKFIYEYSNLKNNLFDCILKPQYVEIKEICELLEHDDNKLINYKHKIIKIIKFGSLFGSLSLIDNYNIETINSNSYYIIINSDKFNIEFIYYYLLYKENEFKEFIKSSTQVLINKCKILKFNILSTNLDNQNYIIDNFKIINNNINIYNTINNNITINLMIKSYIKLNN